MTKQEHRVLLQEVETEKVVRQTEYQQAALEESLLMQQVLPIYHFTLWLR